MLDTIPPEGIFNRFAGHRFVRVDSVTALHGLFDEVISVLRGILVLGTSSMRLMRTIAMLCVAITCVFCLQTTVIALDRLEHALEIEHDANQVAGTVQYCADAPDGCEQTGGLPHPASHAHSGDTATYLLQAAGVASVATEFTAATFPIKAGRLGPGVSQLAPDRPPKG